MKKYIISFLSFFLIISAFLLLINCSNSGNQNPDQNTDDSQNSGYGFTPGSPTNDSSSSNDNDYSYGFDPTAPTRGVTQYYSTDHSSNNANNQDPFYKSNDVLDNEEKWGTSAPITITNESVFEDFRLGEPINSMDDIEELRVYVDLNKSSSGKFYEGQTVVAYWDYGRQKPFRRVIFKSGRGNNAKYNVWFRKNSKDYFHGFFQENHGSLIMVIDYETPTVQNPDNPQQSTLYSGSIWVMQFRTTFGGKNSCNNQANKYIFEHNRDLGPGEEKIPTLAERNRNCWFITSGPYDCRTWRDGRSVDTFKAIYPYGTCYSKLGNFKGLDLLKAFHVSNISYLQVHR